MNGPILELGDPDQATAQRAVEPPGASRWQWILLLVLYVLTLAAQFTSLAFGRIQPEHDFATMLLPSLLFLSVLTLPALWIGLRLGPALGLGAPRFAALLARQPGAMRALARDWVVAGTAGALLGAIFLSVRYAAQPYLPAALPEPGFRGVLGGLAVSFGAAVGEEVWFRLGLMTLLVWAVTRLAGKRKPSGVAVWSVIIIAAFGFGLAHVPQMVAFGAASPVAVASTVLGNVSVGVLYGWCYWRRGLLAAMIAHFSADIVLHVLPALAV